MFIVRLIRFGNQKGRVIKRRRRRRNAWSAHTNFVTWFGGSRRHILIRRVRRRIRRLSKWLDRGRIVVILRNTGARYCDHNTNAFTVFPKKAIKNKSMPSWFEQTLTRRAAIIIHELVHELGFGHPEGTTNRDGALRLARNNSRRARRSPENYEHLYSLYRCTVESSCSTLVFYEASKREGELYMLNNNNELHRTNLHRDWKSTWTEIGSILLPKGENSGDDIFFYDAGDGQIRFINWIMIEEQPNY